MGRKGKKGDQIADDSRYPTGWIVDGHQPLCVRPLRSTRLCHNDPRLYRASRLIDRLALFSFDRLGSVLTPCVAPIVIIEQPATRCVGAGFPFRRPIHALILSAIQFPIRLPHLLPLCFLPRLRPYPRPLFPLNRFTYSPHLNGFFFLFSGLV